MKAKKFEQQFDENVDLTASLDLSNFCKQKTAYEILA